MVWVRMEADVDGSSDKIQWVIKNKEFSASAIINISSIINKYSDISIDNFMCIPIISNDYTTAFVPASSGAYYAGNAMKGKLLSLSLNIENKTINVKRDGGTVRLARKASSSGTVSYQGYVSPTITYSILFIPPSLMPE